MNCRDFVVSIVSLLGGVAVAMLVIKFLMPVSGVALMLIFVICCLIASTVFILSQDIDKQVFARVEENDQRAFQKYMWISNIEDIFSRTLQKHISKSNNQLTTSVANNVDIISALRSLIMLREYEAAMGKARHNEKEKALKRIKETENTIAEIMRNPTEQYAELFSKMDKVKRNFENVTPNNEEQKLHQRVVCLHCGQGLTCSHCNAPIVKGNFRYRPEDLSGYQGLTDF